VDTCCRYVTFVNHGPKNIAKKEQEQAAADRLAKGSGPPPSVPGRGGADTATANDDVYGPTAPPPAAATRRAAPPPPPAAAEEEEVEQELTEAERFAMEEAEKAAIEERARREVELEEKRKQADYKTPDRPKFIVAKANMDRFASVFDKSALTFM
jgi:hypothetical protein